MIRNAHTEKWYFFFFDDFERTLAYSVASARVSRQPSLFFCFLLILLPVVLGPDLSTQHEWPMAFCASPRRLTDVLEAMKLYTKETNNASRIKSSLLDSYIVAPFTIRHFYSRPCFLEDLPRVKC
jgi:hypothetical protein